MDIYQCHKYLPLAANSHHAHQRKSKKHITNDASEISKASFAERQNLTMRMSMRRFTRLTNVFSKKFENHVHALAIYFFWYNWIRIHKTHKLTPAMAAGLTDRLMDWSDLVALLDVREAQAKLAKDPLEFNPVKLRRYAAAPFHIAPRRRRGVVAACRARAAVGAYAACRRANWPVRSRCAQLVRCAASDTVRASHDNSDLGVPNGICHSRSKRTSTLAIGSSKLENLPKAGEIYANTRLLLDAAEDAERIGAATDAIEGALFLVQVAA